MSKCSGVYQSLYGALSFAWGADCSGDAIGHSRCRGPVLARCRLVMFTKRRLHVGSMTVETSFSGKVRRPKFTEFMLLGSLCTCTVAGAPNHLGDHTALDTQLLLQLGRPGDVGEVGSWTIQWEVVPSSPSMWWPAGRASWRPQGSGTRHG